MKNILLLSTLFLSTSASLIAAPLHTSESGDLTATPTPEAGWCSSMPVTVRVDSSDPAHFVDGDPAFASFIRELGARAAAGCNRLEQLVIRGFANGQYVYFAYSYKRTGWKITAPTNVKAFDAQVQEQRVERQRANEQAQQCQAAPRRDPWAVAAAGGGILPGTCQKLLALEDALLTELRRGTRSDPRCRLIRRGGCVFSLADTRLLVQMRGLLPARVVTTVCAHMR